MKKLYIFDFDGTLVDTVVDSVNIFNKALADCGFHEYEFKEGVKPKLEGLFHYTDQFLDPVKKKKRETKPQKLYVKYSLEAECPNTHVYPGIKELLKNLEDRGAKLAICSNRHQKLVENLSSKFLSEFDFVDIVGFTPQIPDKPDPTHFNNIIEKQGLNKEDVVYIGDRGADITAANNANLDLILVTWGEGDKKAYNDSYPVKVVDSPLQILDF